MNNMYVILNKKTGAPKKLTFESHNNESHIFKFENKRKAKQFMRARKINKNENEITFMTGKEMERFN